MDMPDVAPPATLTEMGDMLRQLPPLHPSQQSVGATITIPVDQHQQLLNQQAAERAELAALRKEKQDAEEATKLRAAEKDKATMDALIAKLALFEETRLKHVGLYPKEVEEVGAELYQRGLVNKIDPVSDRVALVEVAASFTMHQKMQQLQQQQAQAQQQQAQQQQLLQQQAMYANMRAQTGMPAPRAQPPIVTRAPGPLMGFGQTAAAPLAPPSASTQGLYGFAGVQAPQPMQAAPLAAPKAKRSVANEEDALVVIRASMFGTHMPEDLEPAISDEVMTQLCHGYEPSKTMTYGSYRPPVSGGMGDEFHGMAMQNKSVIAAVRTADPRMSFQNRQDSWRAAAILEQGLGFCFNPADLRREARESACSGLV